jgi:predicted aldo/keto reductase-like oxidoreductase
MEPIKGGKLASVPKDAEKELGSVSPAAFALGFAASLEGVFTVLSGMSTEEQMEQNLALFGSLKVFESDDYKKAQALAEIIRKSLQIPCTACEYCVPECPKGIQIPKMFSMYNEKDYSEYGTLDKKASDCIKCGACEKMCPQHIEIRTYLEKIAKKNA